MTNTPTVDIHDLRLLLASHTGDPVLYIAVNSGTPNLAVGDSSHPDHSEMVILYGRDLEDEITNSGVPDPENVTDDDLQHLLNVWNVQENIDQICDDLRRTTSR